MIDSEAASLPRRRRLQQATQDVHARLDEAIMQADPFAATDRYGRFLAMQYRLHAISEPIYADPALGRMIPDLPARARRGLFAADLADLGLPLPADMPSSPLAGRGTAFALGWLYVIEGSTLGAAFLAKAAARLGYDAGHGARGLGEPAGGRAPGWHRFVAALDEAVLPPAEEAAVAEGARAAFACARGLTAML